MGKKKTETRIDKLLVELELAPSRERARALIMSGNVLVDESPVTKAGHTVSIDATIRLRGRDHPYVSRGALKLKGALDDLKVNVVDKTILDIGASTGGFTDVCLREGATRVFAVDVGTNQLAYSLRTDPRVTCLEQTNARTLSPEMLPGIADIAVIDVSFISITKLLVQVVSCLKEDGQILAMVKPQFEVGKEKVGKGGVVRDEGDRVSAIEQVANYARDIGLEVLGQTDSSIKGPKGNQETFLYLAKRNT